MGRRKLDKFDLEAEREGKALTGAYKKKGPQGKRFMKVNSGRGDRILQTRAERRHVKEVT